jgi:hypothetical protein
MKTIGTLLGAVALVGMTGIAPTTALAWYEARCSTATS